MKVILSIFPASSADHKALWSDVGAGPLCLALGRALADSGRFSLYPVSSDPDVAQAWSRKSIAHCALSEPSSFSISNSGFSAPGTMQALEHALGAGFISKQDTVALVDYRNPCLAPDTLARAFVEQSRHRMPLASVMESRTHPVRLQVNYLFFGSDTLTFVDHAAPPSIADALVSKSMFLDWNYYAVATGEGLYRRAPGPDSKTMSPLPPSFTPAESNAAVFLYENARSARRVETEENLRLGRDQIIGFSSLDPLSQAQTLCVRERDTGRCFVWVRADSLSPDLEIRYIPVMQNQLDVARADSLSMHAGQTATRTLFGRPYVRIMEIDAEPDGLVLLFLKPSAGKHADLTEPLDLPNAYWRFDPKTQVPICRETGKALTGRQQLQPVFQPDRAVAIARANSFADLEETFLQGGLSGFLLKRPDAEKVLSPIHAAKIRALMDHGHNNPIESSHAQERRQPALF